MENRRILIIKTSSLGDVVHCLQAVAEAKAKFPALQIDWVVERSFADVVQLSGLINRVFAIEFRKWRKQPLSFYRNPPVKSFLTQLRQTQYDLIIDAQGLIKSGFLACHAKGKRAGFNWQSAREPLASLFYHQRYFVDKSQHAIQRQRQLLAKTLGYEATGELPTIMTPRQSSEKRLIFLHGTTWESKKLPLRLWRALVQLATDEGYQVEFFHGNQAELSFAKEMADGFAQVVVNKQLSLAEIIQQLQTATGVISVDTGLAHIAAAMDLPMIMLFGPTNPKLTGAISCHAKNLQASSTATATMQRSYQRADENDENPYMSAFSATDIYQQLKGLIRDKAL